MKCTKCGGEWIPPQSISVSISNCPFCGTAVLNVELAKGYTSLNLFLQYIVSLYGKEIYKNKQKLSNLIADLYAGDEYLKRAYKRVILDDSLSIRIYELSQTSEEERKSFFINLYYY